MPPAAKPGVAKPGAAPRIEIYSLCPFLWNSFGSLCLPFQLRALPGRLRTKRFSANRATTASEGAERLPAFCRKFFYLFTCEFCFSFYTTILFLIITRYKLLFADWWEYLLALFALVWIANQYMSVYARLRLDIQEERLAIKTKERKAARAA